MGSCENCTVVEASSLGLLVLASLLGWPLMKVSAGTQRQVQEVWDSTDCVPILLP